jgi:hypothetical protein
MDSSLLNIEFILISTGIIFMLFLIFKISKKFIKYLIYFSFGAFVFIYLTGCSSGNLNMSSDNEENIAEINLLRINDIPFLKNSKINIEKSLILGEGKSWSGQISLSVPETKPSVFNFYVNNIEDFGWKEQTTIRGEASILNYVGDNNRVIIISVREARFNSSEVIISVSPYAEEFEEKVSEFINDKYLDITDWKKEEN